MRVECEARLAQRVLESGEALLGGRDRGQITQVGDPLVAMRYQVPDASGRPGPVVGHDAVSSQKPGRPVHEHQRLASLPLVEKVTTVMPRRADDQPSNPTQAQRGVQLTL